MLMKVHGFPLRGRIVMVSGICKPQRQDGINDEAFRGIIPDGGRTRGASVIKAVVGFSVGMRFLAQQPFEIRNRIHFHH